jgi:hypothetical protein
LKKEIMKLILCSAMIFLMFLPVTAQAAGDAELFLGAFTETAAAYLNDSFLLLGITADYLVSEILTKEAALENTINVQKRIRVIRAKLKAVSHRRITDLDRQLIRLLENGYACMDLQAWALAKHIEQRSAQTAKNFENQRTQCWERIKDLKSFYSALPPALEFPEPLSTR